MKNKRKICVITGTRAEYGILRPVLQKIYDDDDLELSIVVTGMHLSPEFGLTYRQIEKDGFKINRKVEMLLSSDSPAAISKSIGLGMCGFADIWEDLKPDVIVVLGDRFEIFPAATSAHIARIPIAHLHGGESTEGVFDEAIRHSITKMSHLHFTATEKYRHRVIQLGENPDRVFNFGAPGVEDIESLDLLNKYELEQELGFKFGSKNLLITFHPVTLEDATAKEQFLELIKSLGRVEDTKYIFTMPNADTGGRVIIDMIERFVSERPDKAISFTSMGRIRYLSAMKCVDAVVGNSSSGLLEAPSFKIGTINIGDRQKGRIRAESVIDCQPFERDITAALKYLYSEKFKNVLEVVSNPYVRKGSVNNIVEVLKMYELRGLLKKTFYPIARQ